MVVIKYSCSNETGGSGWYETMIMVSVFTLMIPWPCTYSLNLNSYVRLRNTDRLPLFNWCDGFQILDSILVHVRVDFWGLSVSAGMFPDWCVAHRLCFDNSG